MTTRARLAMVALIALAASGCAHNAASIPGSSDVASTPASSATAGALEATASPSSGSKPSEGLPSSLRSGFRVHAFPIVALPLADRYYADESDAPEAIDYPATADGVPIYTRDGRTYLHPVAAAQQALRQLSTYVATRRGIYLDRAIATADALIAAGVEADGALWIPYRFDFSLHGRSDDTLRAPWYSAMAQGQTLSLVSRLYELTGDARWLGDARAVFTSFVVLGIRPGPWVTWVEDRYLWLEEYPGSTPDHTLNGFLFALFGIYDYYEVSGSPSAQRIFQAGLTTIDHYLTAFRNPGGISRYCLAHHVLSAKYHDIHIAQLRAMTAMTGDDRFAATALQFASDNP